MTETTLLIPDHVWPTLYLLRGLPGSGKSYRAKQMLAAGVKFHLESDMYFVQNGVYCYSARWTMDAHKWCFDTTRIYLHQGASVVVANTFSQLWEMRPYLALWQEIPRVNIYVYHCTGNFDNVHDVPQSVIDKMMNRWEIYPEEVKLHSEMKIQAIREYVNSLDEEV